MVERAAGGVEGGGGWERVAGDGEVAGGGEGGGWWRGWWVV